MQLKLNNQCFGFLITTQIIKELNYISDKIPRSDKKKMNSSYHEHPSGTRIIVTNFSNHSPQKLYQAYENPIKLDKTDTQMQSWLYSSQQMCLFSPLSSCYCVFLWPASTSFLCLPLFSLSITFLTHFCLISCFNTSTSSPHSITTCSTHLLSHLNKTVKNICWHLSAPSLLLQQKISKTDIPSTFISFTVQLFHGWLTSAIHFRIWQDSLLSVWVCLVFNMNHL